MILKKDQLLQAGKYRIIRQIGYGGFGLTYLAEDCFLDRQVVIKAPNQVFQADKEYQKFVRRFQREGQVLAKISHPNVVQVIEFFQEAGIPCLVIAYINGESLNQRIRHQGRLSEAEAVEYFRKLAIALQTVHKAGLIHCDIHPGNIMLQRPSDEPVLIDFGSAKFLQPSTHTVTTTTNVYYTPYEQGISDKRQATLDVYGLAATLYFAVTGKRPQAGIDRKLSGDTLNPPQQYYPELSNWLNHAILKGMALEPEDRPQPMQQWLGLLHPPQPTQRQIKSSKSSSQPRQKIPKYQPYYSTFLFVELGLILLGNMLVGTLIGLVNPGAMALVGVVAVAGIVLWSVGVVGAVAVYVAVYWVVQIIAGENAGFIAGGMACILFMAALWFVVVAGTGAVLWVRIMAGVMAGIVTVFWSLIYCDLEKHYNSWSIVIILEITSTLGLILGSILGWWLKLQGVSLPS